MYASCCYVQEPNDELKEDRSNRLHSRIKIARKENVRRSLQSDSNRDAHGKQRIASIEDSIRRLDPHQIIELLEMSAKDDRDGSFLCLQTLKNSPFDTAAKPSKRDKDSTRCRSTRTRVWTKTTTWWVKWKLLGFFSIHEHSFVVRIRQRTINRRSDYRETFLVALSVKFIMNERLIYRCKVYFSNIAIEKLRDDLFIIINQASKH